MQKNKTFLIICVDFSRVKYYNIITARETEQVSGQEQKGERDGRNDK